jgi:hypothetical protein
MSTCDTCRECRCGTPENTVRLHTTGLLLGYQMTSMKSQWTNAEEAITQLKTAGAMTAPSLLAVPERRIAS